MYWERFIWINNVQGAGKKRQVSFCLLRETEFLCVEARIVNREREASLFSRPSS